MKANNYIIILWLLLNTYWCLCEGCNLLAWTDDAFLWEVFYNPKSFLQVNYNSRRFVKMWTSLKIGTISTVLFRTIFSAKLGFTITPTGN